MRLWFVFLLVFSASFGASADEVHFVLINGTSYPIRSLVLSQSDIGAWGPNVVSSPSIEPGVRREIFVRGAIVDCTVE